MSKARSVFWVVMSVSVGTVVSVPVLIGTTWAATMPSWNAPKVQQSAEQQQLKPWAPPIRAGNRTQSTATRFRPAIRSPFRTWEKLWAVIWWGSRVSAPVQSAVTVRNQSICRGDMNRQIGSIVEQTVRAINAGKDGDAAKLLARFQDRLMCLDIKSMWTIDFVMAAFMANASMLPPMQRDQAVKGMLNIALLVFDQIQYTGRSYSLPVFFYHRKQVSRALENYSGKELGLWFYDYSSGTMRRYTFDRKQPGFSNGLMAMISRPSRFANGACSITEMVGQGFRCNGVPGGKSGGGGGAGASASAGGQLSCMTAAASMSGMQRQMSCMARAGSGGNSVSSWMARARPSINMRGVLDDFCSGRTGEDPVSPVDAASHDESLFDTAKKAWNDFTTSLFSGSDSNAGQSGNNQKSGSSMTVDMDCVANSWGEESAKSCTTITLANFDNGSSSNMPADGGTVDGTGGCRASTNAIARANRLFKCTGSGGRPGSGGAGGPLAGQNAPGTRSMPAPGSAGGAGGMSGLMACAVQGGSLVRTSMNDRRCSQSMCTPGQSCSCNGGGGSAPAEVRQQIQRTIFSPNRSNIGARDPRPDSDVGGAPRFGGAGDPATNPFGGKSPGGGR